MPATTSCSHLCHAVSQMVLRVTGTTQPAPLGVVRQRSSAVNVVELCPPPPLRYVCGQLATLIDRCAQVALAALDGVRPLNEVEIVEVGCGAGGASFELSKVVGECHRLILPGEAIFHRSMPPRAGSLPQTVNSTPVGVQPRHRATFQVIGECHHVVPSRAGLQRLWRANTPPSNISRQPRGKRYEECYPPRCSRARGSLGESTCAPKI